MMSRFLIYAVINKQFYSSELVLIYLNSFICRFLVYYNEVYNDLSHSTYFQAYSLKMPGRPGQVEQNTIGIGKIREIRAFGILREQEEKLYGWN